MDTNTIIERVSYHLRAAAGGAQKSNREAAKEMGCHPSTVGRYLDRPGDMTVRAYFDLCSVYGVDPDRLFMAAIEDARR